ncbi:MAG TPA: efflux RND transporter periplasmic adaptor subunit [Myxococcota bacterium]|nr:efflux RND transporter periplasmic adaptor subunit [Myxococcota bacterium]
MPLPRPRRLRGRPCARLAVAPAGLVLVLALGGCRGPAEDAAVATAVAERTRLERIVVATGTIEPEKEVQVRPRVAGIIERIAVEEGDVVERGQVLLEIEREILEAQVREADAAVEAAGVELHFANVELGRMQALRDRGAASHQKLDDASSRSQGAKAKLAQARARRDSLRVQLRYSTVVSPLAGRVLDVYVEEGNAVSPVTAVTGGTLLLSLAATDSYHLKGLVDENEIARVTVGQPARIRTEAFGGRTFEGRVAEISPVGERVQNVTYFEVEIEVVDADAQLLMPRMSGDAEIVAEVVEDALAIPETALRYRGDRIYVEARDGADPPAFAEHDVEVGIVDGDRVQILSGLEDGAEVRLQ